MKTLLPRIRQFLQLFLSDRTLAVYELSRADNLVELEQLQKRMS